MNFAIHGKLINLFQGSIDAITETLTKIPYDPPGDPWAEVQKHKGRAAAYLDAAHIYREEKSKMLIDSNITDILQARIDKLEKALDAEQAEEEPDAEEIAYIDGQMEAYYKAIKLIKSAERATKEG